MAIPDLGALLSCLVATTSTIEVREVLKQVGDRSELGLDEPFGADFRWHAFGDNPSNLSTIGLGTKPGRSLTERLTNAMDALLEDRVSPGISLPNSPRLAALQWFGRPVSGPDNGLFKWSYSAEGIDRRIDVVLHLSGDENAPTVDVVDDGIGIEAEALPATILSLHGHNKITKRYLIGAFGQGGSSTLGFSEFALILSRTRRSQPKSPSL